MATVREATYDLLRALGMTTVFGNPGSTEEPFLADFPADFTYVLALQESSAVAMADGYAQITGKPAHVNLHTAPGTGHAMGSLVTTWHNKTPLIVTCGQQARTMLLLEPRLTNRGAAELARPYVKWGHEPVRAQDIPAALMRAYATAVQPPAGPVLLSLPLDDWQQPVGRTPTPRRVSTRFAPDPRRLSDVADELAISRRPVLVTGPGVDHSAGWAAAVALAERLRAPVWSAPAPERMGFPEDHPQYQGVLPFAIGPLAEELRGHDVVLVVGAPVFRYYPYVAGDYLPPGARLLHVSDDPDEVARAPVGDSLLGDPELTCAALAGLVPEGLNRPMPPARSASPAPEVPDQAPFTPEAVFSVLARHRPAESILVQESPSNLAALRRQVRVVRPASYFTTASGGLGYGLPAAVGVALGERHTGGGRPVIAVLGDGAFQYSVQALWTAAQLSLPVTFVVLVNRQYATLKAFAQLARTAGVPGLELPGLDIPGIARGFGCAARTVGSAEELVEAVAAAGTGAGPVVLAVPIGTEVPPLL
jgi:benzoylformate decarboxylase